MSSCDSFPLLVHGTLPAGEQGVTVTVHGRVHVLDRFTVPEGEGAARVVQVLQSHGWVMAGANRVARANSVAGV